MLNQTCEYNIYLPTQKLNLKVVFCWFSVLDIIFLTAQKEKHVNSDLDLVCEEGKKSFLSALFRV